MRSIITKKLTGLFSSLQVDRFARRLILSMILVAILTMAIGGLPVIVMIWVQLEQQVRLRVQNAQVGTQALYDVERARLMDAARLVSESPTLCSLAVRQNTSKIESYLNILQQDIKTDSLFVITASGQTISSDNIGVPEPAMLIADRELPFSDFIPWTTPPGLLVVSAANIQPPIDCETPGTSKVILVRLLDDEFMHALAQNTGLEQSLIVNNVRVATSFDELPDWPLVPAVMAGDIQSDKGCCTGSVKRTDEYYLGYFPLLNNQQNRVAVGEVALPENVTQVGMWRTIMFLLGVGFIAILGGTILATYASHRITEPLTNLADSAERMSAGDLDTPVSVRSNLVELKRLAQQLDRARRHLQETFQATQQETKHFERLFGAIHEGVIVLDEGGNVTFFNADAEKILGVNAAEAIQKHFTHLFRPAPGEVVTIREVLQPENGAPPARHITIMDAQERPVTLAVSASTLTTDSPFDHQHERVLVLRDVGEEQMVNLLRAKLMANVAHEVRTPLSGIIASLELLHEEGPTLKPEELSELINAIRLSTLRLHTLLDNLLESAILDAGSFRMRHRPIRFQDVLTAAITMMMPLIKRRHQKLEVLSPANLPSFWADPDRLTQVLVNLLSNASKFSPMGSPIQLVVEHEKNLLTVSVLDAGPGLPTGLFADLFKRFAIGEQPQGAQYGIGLGLSVVKAIIEAHQGQVGAENRAEGGARVWFTLPLTIAQQEEN